MVDPSVHRFRMNQHGRDERPGGSDFGRDERLGGSDFGSAREDSRHSFNEGAARRHVRKSRSRTRRPSGNRAERMQVSQKHRHSKKSTPIEQHSKGESSSASSSSSSSESKTGTSSSSSSSSSKQSSSDRESTQSAPISSAKSLTDKHTKTLHSEGEPIRMQSPPGPTSKGSASSGVEDKSMHSSPGLMEDKSMLSSPGLMEDKSMHSSPGLMAKRKLFTEKDYVSSRSEDKSIHSSTRPTSKEKSSQEKHLTSSSSEDESMHESSTKPTSKGNVITYTYSDTSGSEDESTESSTRPTSMGKSSAYNLSATSSSEDESIQLSKVPTPKGNSQVPDTRSVTSGSKDEYMETPSGPNSKGEADPNTLSATFTRPTSNGNPSPYRYSTTSSSEDETMQSSNRLTAEEKAFPNTRSATSGSEDESRELSTRPTSQEEFFPDKYSTTSRSEDLSMQSLNRPTPKGNSQVPDTRSATSGSKDESIHYLQDESMQSSNRPTPRPTPKESQDSDSATSISEDEMANKNRRTGTESLELEEVSSTPLSEESHYENGGAEPIDDQYRKEWGDKLTVKFKVSLPEVGHDLVGGSLQFLRMPQFLPVEAGAFDAESLKDSMTPDDLKDEQARGDFLNRLKTTVRWRENQDKVKESNARIVRWSDGTETFHVGAEVFDVMHHKVIDDKNQLYVRLESCYQVQGSIGDKMTLRPKLDSTFGQSHVQGLRNRAMNKPQTGLVKVISDLVTNPMVDRQQRAKADLANLRKEDRLRRREIQLSLRKPRVKPMRHCTADDSDLEQPTGEQEDKIGRNSAPGIRTNRNVAVISGKKVSTDEEDDEDAYDSDVNDIINDEELDYYEDDDVDEELSDEPRASTSKPKKALSRSPMTRTRKRKAKQLVYSDSNSD